MTVKRVVTPNRFIGSSTDTKPTQATNPRVRNGDTFYEYQDGVIIRKWITYDGATWVETDVGAASSTVSSEPMFGKPTLQWLKNNGTASNGRAEWSKEWGRYGQYSAKLMPGIQSAGDDYASVSFTVNDMPLTDLETINWVYRMGATENEAPNVAIHVYDPDIVDARADITLTHSGTHSPTSTSGWQHFELLTTSDGLFYYGNNLPESGTTGLTQSDGTETTQYTLAQYQADAVFSTYVISKITIEFGYSSDATYLNPAHIAKISVNDIDIPLEPSVEEQLNIARDDLAKAQRVIPAWAFGEPSLFASRQADAVWARTPPASVYQKSPTQWSAKLYVENTNDDWASLVIPVNEMKVTDLSSAQWTSYLTNAESGGINIVVWVHDRTDFSKRAEITQLMGLVNKSAGFNVETLNATSDELFFYGENTTGTDLTAGTNYTWTEFQDDALFSTWDIYRITLDYGWLASSTQEDAWITELAINGQSIPLKPDSGGTGRIGHRWVEHANDVVALTLAPKTPFRLLNIDIHLSAALADTELVTITKDSGYGTDGYGDTVIFSENLFTGTRLSYHGAFGEGYEFGAPDELDIALSANSLNRNIGINVAYEIL